MTDAEVQQWLDALLGYEYPVNLTAFNGRNQFGNNWFDQNFLPGNRDQTIEFEDRFRNNAAEHAEAWFEVVFWKLFALPHRRNGLTLAVIQRCHGQQPIDFWNACTHFIQEGSLETFAVLKGFFVATNALPVVATFVAFAAPERFPMIDRWIVQWVTSYLHEYPQAEHRGLFARQHDGALTTAHHDWDFYCAWIEWCRSSAIILSNLTGQHWRARDVEMAAFQNARGGLPALPLIA
jgi:hypothetical protein